VCTNQVLFLELRKLRKLTDEDVFEMDWLMELMRELIEAIFDWISNDKEIWGNIEEKLNLEHPDIRNQVCAIVLCLENCLLLVCSCICSHFVVHYRVLL
jgi:hypothetical protein